MVGFWICFSSRIEIFFWLVDLIFIKQKLVSCSVFFKFYYRVRLELGQFFFFSHRYPKRSQVANKRPRDCLEFIWNRNSNPYFYTATRRDEAEVCLSSSPIWDLAFEAWSSWIITILNIETKEFLSQARQGGREKWRIKSLLSGVTPQWATYLGQLILIIISKALSPGALTCPLFTSDRF